VIKKTPILHGTSNTDFMKIIIAVFILFLSTPIWGQIDAVNSTLKDLKVKPSQTDTRITIADEPHWIQYDASLKNNKLFLFLPGTNGIPVKGPKLVFKTAIEQKYRVINLGYVNTPAIAQMCRGANLENDEDCAENFRKKRIYGSATSDLISDQSYDAIIPRLTKLLQYLIKQYPDDHWEYYLNDNQEVQWEHITVAGQSQGGGMAAMIAQDHIVHKIIDFSGGWDNKTPTTIAPWYYKKSKTPNSSWYGFYHINERKASVINESYRAMGIPTNQIFPLDKDVPKKRKAHSQGVRNILYKDLWVEALGSGL